MYQFTFSAAELTKLTGRLAGKAMSRPASKDVAVKRLTETLTKVAGNDLANRTLAMLAKLSEMPKAEEVIDAVLQRVSKAADAKELKKPKAADKEPKAADKEPKAAKAAKVAKTPKEPKAANGEDVHRGRKPKFAGMNLYPKVEHNPRRPKSQGHRSMSIILASPGISAEDFAKKGGRYMDLRWDIEKGYVVAKTA